MICNKLYWNEDSNWDISKHIHAYLWKKDFKAAALILKDNQFYVDDVQELLDAMEKKGHGTFKVPFYNDPKENSIAEKDDRWLLKAVNKIERVLDERRRKRITDTSKNSARLSERRQENSDR